VSSFSKKGLSAVYIASDVTDPAVLKDAAQGHYQLVFLTPEMVLSKSRWRHVIEGDVYSGRLRAIIIDEAHCVKKW